MEMMWVVDRWERGIVRVEEGMGLWTRGKVSVVLKRIKCARGTLSVNLPEFLVI